MHTDDFIIILILILAAAATLFFIGYRTGSSAREVEAVKHNAAIWVVDDNGDTKFKWNDNEVHPVLNLSHQ